MLGPLMFLLYINNINENISSTIHLFADECIVYWSIIKGEDTDILQKHLDEIFNWACKWHLNLMLISVYYCESQGIVHSLQIVKS